MDKTVRHSTSDLTCKEQNMHIRMEESHMEEDRALGVLLLDAWTIALHCIEINQGHGYSSQSQQEIRGPRVDEATTTWG
jgi:hypothetical protein